MNPGENTLPSEILQRYDILAHVGSGGMGDVYKARDRETGEIVALKLLKPHFTSDALMMARFKNELRLARKITHKNVCRIHEFYRGETAAYISMEFVEGESLRAVLSRVGCLDIDRGLDVATQLCAGLREAHAQEVVHRDLKPENIMVDINGTVKIMDFGVSRSLTSGATATGMIVGTPLYMAPEQAEGKQVDLRADIYSLGLMLYEIFTGRVPFTGDTPVAVALKQIRETPRSPREIEPNMPEFVERAILRCLEKDPVLRYQSLDALESQMRMIRTPVRSALPMQAPEPAPAVAHQPVNLDSGLIDTATARRIFLLIQAGFLALYLVTLFYLDAAVFHIERYLSVPQSLATVGLVVAAATGIAVRLFLTSMMALRHPAGGQRFSRLFPFLLFLDGLWAASPLLLSERIGFGTAFACIAGLAYLPFSQKTLVENMYVLRG